MSKRKNEEILNNIMKENYLRLSKEAIVSAMLKTEIAGQRIFYLYLNQRGFNIDPLSMDQHRSDGIIDNAIIECKLNENEGGGIKKAEQELYEIIPNRLMNKGLRVPYYRIYVELETFLVEVYDAEGILIETFDWYIEYDKFKNYFYNKEKLYEYDLNNNNVDLVEVIQCIYKEFKIKSKIEAYKYLKQGIKGWFKPFDLNNINKLILNNDKMNEKYVQKEQGAFFTPTRYVTISTNYVLQAIQNSIKDGYDDYVIIDRCVGVGNLESLFSENIYSHLILGTINEAEAFTANIRFNNLANVNVIDALSEDGVKFYQNAIEEYKKKNNVKKLAVILLENPPYVQVNSNKDGGIKSNYNKTWVHQQMKKHGNDLDEQFIFSAFEYYNPYAYIHYGPIKSWKTKHLVSKEVKAAYLCNRKYFNASEAAIALLYWGNKDVDYDEIEFDNDIGDKFIVKKVNNTISELYEDDGEKNGVCVIEARNYSFASPRLTGSINDGDKYGNKWVSKANLLNVLPLFCASRDEISETGNINGIKDYRYIDTVYKSSDKGKIYQNDNELLQYCLLYTLCTKKNSCNSDSKFFKVANNLLKAPYKNHIIYKTYKYLVDQTKINGLSNIEKYNNIKYGKLWKYHHLYPKIILIETELKQLYINKIRPKLCKYELLK